MLMRFDPFREFDRLVDQVWSGILRPAGMPMDAFRQGDHLVVRFDLPGVDPRLCRAHRGEERAHGLGRADLAARGI